MAIAATIDIIFIVLTVTSPSHTRRHRPRGTTSAVGREQYQGRRTAVVWLASGVSIAAMLTVCCESPSPRPLPFRERLIQTVSRQSCQVHRALTVARSLPLELATSLQPMPPIPNDWRACEKYSRRRWRFRRMPAARSSRQTCGEESVRQQVELLLDSHERREKLQKRRRPRRRLRTGITRNLEGTRIGPYLLGARIGAGGMGEVYKARDTRLNRTVAIKVLPAASGRRSAGTRALRAGSACGRGAESSAHLHAL